MMGLKTIMKSQVSPQYLREGKIYATIVEVKSPVYYVIKESPSMNNASLFASKFLELEESMQKYYRSLERTFFQLPVKDTVLIVEHEKKYYRAKVCSILNLPRSYLIKVYLLDYGKECSVPKSSLFEMHPDFMSVPFQVIDFKLPGLDPISLVMNPCDLAVEYGTAAGWDPSASIFIEGIWKALRNAFIKVEGAAKNCIFGTLHVTLQDGEEICINDELLFKKFASQDPDCWNNITRLAEILSKEKLQSNQNVSGSQSKNPEVLMSSCIPSESSPISQLDSPGPLKILKSSVTSTIVSEPLNAQKSGVEKLRDILRAKKSQLHCKTSPEGKTESASQSNTEEKSLKQKETIKELEKCKAELLENLKDVCNSMKEAVQNVRKHLTEIENPTTNQETNMSENVNESSLNTSKDTALKTMEESKCDETISSPPNASTSRKFREMIARKKAVRNQQNLSQTLDDTSCYNSPSHVTDSALDNSHSSELGRSEKLSPDLTISMTQMKITGSDLPPSTPTSCKFPKAETKIHEPENAATTKIHEPENDVTVQDVGVAKSICSVKSDNEQSVESQPSEEQEEISKKVDPAKKRSFFERNKKARALFLAQNKSKQDQNNANPQLEVISPLKPSEIEIQLEASNTKIAAESCTASKSSESGTELIAIDTQNPDANVLELIEVSESGKSRESRMSTEPKEIIKPKVDQGKLKTSFERNRKDRELFMALTKSKQDQDNKGLISEMSSPPLVVRRPFETDKILEVTAETKNTDASFGNDPDILDFVNESPDSNSNR